MTHPDDTKAQGSNDNGGNKQPAGEGAKVAPIRAKRPCPECGKPSARDTYPYCSPRCKDLDLNRWLSGAYAIPVREEEEQTQAQDPRGDRTGDEGS